MRQVKSFSALACLFDDLPAHTPGKWFLISEHHILTERGRQFANKSGERPVVLHRAAGPNAIVYPRSSSIGGGFRHPAHTHAQIGCVINRLGWVVLDCPCTIDSQALTSRAFSCFESEDSPLMQELTKVNSQ